MRVEYPQKHLAATRDEPRQAFDKARRKLGLGRRAAHVNKFAAVITDQREAVAQAEAKRTSFNEGLSEVVAGRLLRRR